MKKLMMILASVSLTTPVLGTAVACHKANVGQIKIPTVYAIKENLKKQGYNVDNLDVDLAPGMKSATIRFMPDVPNRPFLTKKIDLAGTINDISKIITITSMPYDKSFKDEEAKIGLKPATVLEAVNKLNGTNFTLADVEIDVDQNTFNSTITPKPGGNFTGPQVEIINEPIKFSQAFPVENIGDIYITNNVWDDYKEDTTNNVMQIIAAIMEFVGDRNRFAGLYKTTMFSAIVNAISNKNAIDLTINTNNGEGTLRITVSVDDVIIKSTLTAKFKIKTTPRLFLNFNNKTPENNEIIDVKLDKHYSKENEDDLRYDLVTKVIGKEFANQYKEIWYDELKVIFKEDGKGAEVTAKPGSKILAVSDNTAQELTKIPAYKLNVTFN